MATLSQSMKLNDSFTPVLLNMSTAMSSTLQGFEQFKQAINDTMDIGEFEEAQKAIDGITDEIIQAQEEQEDFNDTIQRTTTSANSLSGVLTKIVSAYALIQTGKEFISGSDEYSGSIAKLNIINDGLQTTDELNKKIYASAQMARGSYQDMVDIVGKLGITASDAFSSNEEMVYFAELMNKSFKVVGASATEQSSAMYQLTQAMASGRLQGDEYRSILENAPTLAQAIADEMDVGLGALKDLSSEGLITSDIIKSALFNASDEINDQFEQIPVTFSDVTTSVKNQITGRLQSAFEKFSAFLNSSTGQEFIVNITNNILTAVTVASKLLDVIIWIATVFTENWSVLAPIVYTLVGAIVLLEVASLAYNAVLAVQSGLQTVAAASQALMTGSTFAATVAQHGLNAALFACPLVWILALIVATVAGVILFVKWIDSMGYTVEMQVGNMVGQFYMLLAHVRNVITLTQNGFGAFAQFFENVMVDPIGAVKMLFLDLTTTAINYIYKMAEALQAVVNLLPDTEVDLTGNLDNVLAMIETAKSELEAETGVTSFEPIEFASLTDAYAEGFQVGTDGLADIEGMLNLDNLTSTLIPDDSLYSFDGVDIDTIDYVGEVGSISDDVDVSSEDLKAMRELAEMKSIQNFVTLQPSVNLTTGDINSVADYETILEDIDRHLEEETAASAKVVFDVG